MTIMDYYWLLFPLIKYRSNINQYICRLILNPNWCYHSHLMCFRKCSWIWFIFSSSSVSRKPSLFTDRDKITTPGNVGIDGQFMEYGGIYQKKHENAGTCCKNCETYGKIIEQSWNITLYQQEGSTFSI